MTGNARAEQQITVNDIEVGMRVYEALAHHARAGKGAPIGYKDLLTLARSLHPKDAVLGRAVPIGIGMKLRFVDAPPPHSTGRAPTRNCRPSPAPSAPPCRRA